MDGNGSGAGADGGRHALPALEAPVVLAPMAGYTHLPFRRLCRRFGAALVYTEMVNVDGVVRGVRTVLAALATAPDERPVAAHLYGHDPAVFAEAAAYVGQRGVFDAIDINAGCPVRRVVARGAGAALMRDPQRLHDIVQAVRRASGLPVLVKTRTGPSAGSVNISETLRAVEEAGAAALAVHARPTAQRHSGPADWDRIAEVKQSARIAVFGNGGVRSAADAVRRWRETGVDAVMIGRAALGNPWIFQQVRAQLAGGEAAGPSLADKRPVILEHLAGLIAQAPSARGRRPRTDPVGAAGAAARQFRGHLVHYLAGYRGSLEMRRGLNDIREPADITAAIDRLAALNP